MLALAEAIGEIAGAKDSGSRPGRISRIFSGFFLLNSLIKESWGFCPPPLRDPEVSSKGFLHLML